jgi:superfamily II DNA or RNA helicase
MAGFVSEERLAYGNWAALERAIARLLEHTGFKDVGIVGGSGDHGADVVGTINGTRWVVQVKYRQSGTIDSSAAKEAVRAMSVYGAKVAVAATNVTFSHDARQFWQETKSNGIEIRLWEGSTLLDFFAKLQTRSAAHRELRDYQSLAVDAVEAARSRGSNKALVLMATGLGKSLVASEVVAQELARNPHQEVLFLAHTTPLVRQLECAAWSQLERQYSTHLWTDGELPAYSGGVIFATWQSIASAFERETMDGRFGLVVVDEAHHAPSDAFSRLLLRLSPNFLLGLTATPWRGDERSLSTLFSEPVFTMDIVDGMQRGYLADVDYRMLTDGIDWNEIRSLSRQGLTVRNLNEHLIMPDRDVALVQKFADHFRSIPAPRALAFCRSIEHANRLQPLLAAQGIRAALLHSDLPREQRFMNLSGFRSGAIGCLLSVEMLNEGIDVPDVNLVAFMRVTHSRRIFVQQLGRGLRLVQGKQRVLVLDFVADIRRIAAGLQLNREAAARGAGSEVIRYPDGRIVKFENDEPASFFREYLADIASVEDLDDGARLRFPDTMPANPPADW